MSVEKSKRNTRSSQERSKVWTPPNDLDTPEPPEGYQYRWVRGNIRADDDSMNVIKRQRQGYEVVSAEEVKSLGLDGKEGGRHAGAATVGDLVLMKVPVEVAEQRDAFYRGKSKRLQESVDHELMRENTTAMPISKSRTTTISTGVPTQTFEDE